MTESGPVDVTRGFVRSPAARWRDRCDPCRLGEVERRLDTAWWFVLCLRPQSEFRAIDWLEQRGVFAWTPVTLKRRRWNAHTPRETRRFPSAPGYALAGLDRLSEQWHWLLGCPDLRFVLQPSDAETPRPISRACVEAIRDHLVDDETAPRTSPAVPIAEGDAVRISVGPFASLEGVVAGLDGWDARIVLTMLGAAREIAASVSTLERIDG